MLHCDRFGYHPFHSAWFQKFDQRDEVVGLQFDDFSIPAILSHARDETAKLLFLFVKLQFAQDRNTTEAYPGQVIRRGQSN